MKTKPAERIEKPKAQPAPRHPAPVTPLAAANVADMVGNLALQRELGSGVIQAKRSVSQPNDPDEREADDVAEHLQERHLDARFRLAGPSSPPSRALQGGAGRPLPPSVRAFFEPRFGHDFQPVRVHTNAHAATSARAIESRAFTAGTDIVFAEGEYAPESHEGRQLLAHELTHVVQQTRSGKTGSAALQRQTGVAETTANARPRSTRRQRPPRALVALPALEDAPSAFVRQIEQLHGELLPAFQRAIDRVDEPDIHTTGLQLLALWTMIEGSHADLADPGPDLLAYTEARDAILRTLGPQRFRGELLRGERSSGEVPALQVEGDLGPVIFKHVEDSAWTAKDAHALVALLGRVATEGGLTEQEQWQAIGLLRQHPNPWHTAYMRTATRVFGVDNTFQVAFWGSALRGLELTFAAADWVYEQGRVAPGESVGVLELLPRDRMVRLLQPQSAKELAVELYDDEAVGLQLLRGYNRTVVAAAGDEGWLPAGTNVIVDPGLLSGMYATIFQAAVSMRELVDRPYLEAQPEGAAVTGTTARYIAHWPEPPPPAGAFRLNTGESLWASLRSRVRKVVLFWWVEHDPAAVAAGLVPATKDLGEMELLPEQLGTAHAAVAHRLRAPGTHIIRCDVSFDAKEPHDDFILEESLGGSHVELRHPQPVASLEEVTSLEWLRIQDPRKLLLLATTESFAEAAWFREVHPEFSSLVPAPTAKTEGAEEGAPESAEKVEGERYLRGDPRGLLASLRQIRVKLPEGDRRDDVDKQIRVLEETLHQLGPEGLRPIDAMYVSAEDRATTIPLAIFVGFDPNGHRPSDLALWDFTLAGPTRVYAPFLGPYDLRQGLRELLKKFADDAPYPTGNIRFAVGPWSLPGDQPELIAETFTFETDGGMGIDDVLRALSMAALGVAVVGAFVFPPIAVPAFYVSTLLAGAAGTASIYDRLEHGDFEWDLQTGMDLLDIAGAVTLGIGSAVNVSARGVGTMTVIGRIQKGLDIIQIGVLAGTHVTQVGGAAIAGDQKRLAEALLHALGDGALYLVVHRASARVAEFQRTSGADVPLRLEPGEAVRPHAEVDLPGGQRAATARGTTRGGEGQRPAAEPRTPEQHRVEHEAWTERLREVGLAPRDPVGTSAGRPVERGTFREDLATPDEALAAYDEALAGAGGREVGVYRSVETGTYAVRVGDEHTVSAPPKGKWETVLHHHPNQENVLTRRLPAPQDVQSTVLDAFRASRKVTEFIDFQYPDGRRGRSAYTVDPVSERITVEWERPDGTRQQREFNSLEKYAEFYGERTTYVDPTSPEYEWIMRDIADFYKSQPVYGQTARGAARGRRFGEPGLQLDVPVRTPTSEVVERPAGEPVREGAAVETTPIERVERGKVVKPAEPASALQEKMTELQRERLRLDRELHANITKNKELTETVEKETQAARELLDLALKAPPEQKAALNDAAREAHRRKLAALEEIDRLSSGDDLIRALERTRDAIHRTDILLNPEKHRAVLPCFSGDTAAWTASGTRPIDQMHAGEVVLGFDFETGEVVRRPVRAVLKNRSQHFYDLTVAGEVIHATGRHRFWVEDRSTWTAARNLEAGMALKSVDGHTVNVESITLREHLDVETYNLSVEDVSNYFVGPGVLVHNAGIDIKLGGVFIIYRGTNKNFPGYLYIGQTEQGAIVRQRRHRSFAIEQLKAHAEGKKTLSEAQVDFYTFMTEVELEEIVVGLDNKDQADFLEQHNMDIERTLHGEDALMNRREQIASEYHAEEVTARIVNDPKVQAAGYCPK